MNSRFKLLFLTDSWRIHKHVCLEINSDLNQKLTFRISKKKNDFRETFKKKMLLLINFAQNSLNQNGISTKLKIFSLHSYQIYYNSKVRNMILKLTCDSKSKITFHKPKAL